MEYAETHPTSLVTTSRRMLFASVFGSANATSLCIERRLKIYKASRVENRPVILSPSFVSTSIVTVPEAPVVVQSSGLPSAEPCTRLKLEAWAAHTTLLQSVLLFVWGGTH